MPAMKIESLQDSLLIALDVQDDEVDRPVMLLEELVEGGRPHGDRAGNGAGALEALVVWRRRVGVGKHLKAVDDRQGRCVRVSRSGERRLNNAAVWTH